MTSPFSPGVTVAAYLRDSGGDNQDLSTQQQHQAISAWCIQNNLILTQIYRDEAAPGSSTVGRNAFLSMIDHFTSGAIKEKGIIVWDFARFSREIDDSQFYKGDLRRRGFIIHSINEDLPSGLDGRLYEFINDWKNAKYLADLSKNVVRGLQHGFSSNHSMHGTPPRGFRMGPDIYLGQRRNGSSHIVHQWEPDPDLIPLIRQAFELRASGASYAQITKATGLYHNKNSWNHFFSNPIYKGVLRYGDQVVENYCSPIVEPKVWQFVQEVNMQHQINSPIQRENNLPSGYPDQVAPIPSHPRRKTSPYLLSGLARCGQCGSPLNGNTMRARGKYVNRYYTCQAKKLTNGLTCQAPNIPQEELETGILNEIRERILEPDFILSIYSQMEADAAQGTAELRKTISALEVQKPPIQSAIKNIIATISAIGHSPALVSALKENEANLQDLQTRISSIEYRISVLENLPSPSQVTITADNLRTALNTNDPDKLRNRLRALVDHIDVKAVDNKITGVIWYYLPTGDFMDLGFMAIGLSHRGASIHRLPFAWNHFNTNHFIVTSV
jgi:DNA invertase Pin-like site-specific DNA recombinase